MKNVKIIISYVCSFDPKMRRLTWNAIDAACLNPSPFERGGSKSHNNWIGRVKTWSLRECATLSRIFYKDGKSVSYWGCGSLVRRSCLKQPTKCVHLIRPTTLRSPVDLRVVSWMFETGGVDIVLKRDQYLMVTYVELLIVLLATPNPEAKHQRLPQLSFKQVEKLVDRAPNILNSSSKHIDEHSTAIKSTFLFAVRGKQAWCASASIMCAVTKKNLYCAGQLYRILHHEWTYRWSQVSRCSVGDVEHCTTVLNRIISGKVLLLVDEITNHRNMRVWTTLPKRTGVISPINVLKRGKEAELDVFPENLFIAALAASAELFLPLIR